MVNNNKLFTELIQKQRPNILIDKKLQLNDLKRICKYVSNSIFNPSKCCIWNGYITNANNENKGTYINFYFQSRKVALHRLLYYNFIGELENDEYLKFDCENKGRCCNINHISKYKYRQKKTTKNNIKKTKYITITNRDCSNNEMDNKLYLTFD
jgi:hypothetical protein